MSFIVRFSGRCTSCPIHNDKHIFHEMEKDPENPNKSRPKSFNCPIPGCYFIFDGPTRQWYKKGQKASAKNCAVNEEDFLIALLISYHNLEISFSLDPWDPLKPDPTSPSGLRDSNEKEDENSSQKLFSKQFTANYKNVAEKYPQFERLRNMAKLVALAKYLRDSGVKINEDSIISSLLKKGIKIDNFLCSGPLKKNQHVKNKEKVPRLTASREKVEGNYKSIITLYGGVNLSTNINCNVTNTFELPKGITKQFLAYISADSTKNSNQSREIRTPNGNYHCWLIPNPFLKIDSALFLLVTCYDMHMFWVDELAMQIFEKSTEYNYKELPKQNLRLRSHETNNFSPINPNYNDEDGDEQLKLALEMSKFDF